MVRSSSAASPLRPLVATSSLPSLAHRGATPPAGLASVSLPASPMSAAKAYESAGAEERALLRKRNRELESQLKRAMTTLARERKEHKLSEQQHKQQRHDEDQMLNQWQQEKDAAVARVRQQADAQLDKVKQGTKSELAALEEQTKQLKQHERQQRVELLQRQIARRIMNQGLVRGWEDVRT